MTGLLLARYSARLTDHVTVTGTVVVGTMVSISGASGVAPSAAVDQARRCAALTHGVRDSAIRIEAIRLTHIGYGDCSVMPDWDDNEPIPADIAGFVNPPTAPATATNRNPSRN